MFHVGRASISVDEAKAVLPAPVTDILSGITPSLSLFLSHVCSSVDDRVSHFP